MSFRGRGSVMLSACGQSKEVLMIDAERFGLYLEYRGRHPGNDDAWEILWTALAFATKF